MLDIKFIRENPEAVKENIRKKFQDEKLPLVDRVLVLDEENRAAITEASELRAQRNTLSKQVGMLMGQAKKDPSKLEEAEAVKAKVKANALAFIAGDAVRMVDNPAGRCSVPVIQALIFPISPVLPADR